jgi:PDZ domain
MKAMVGLAMLLLAGCASNGYEKFYTAQPKAAELVASPLIDKPPKEPLLVTVSQQNAQATFRDLARHGYVPIGESSFYGPARRTSNDQAIEQAKKVGASLVTVGVSFRDTLTGSNQFTLPGAPVTSTVNTVGNVNGYGYSANSTVTSPGAPVTYNIPYAVDRNNYDAVFWVHEGADKFKLGAKTDELPANLVTRFHRNTGVYCPLIIVGTPAFKANILDGDVIVKIDDRDVIDVQSFRDQLVKLSGQPVTLQILRGDETLNLKLTLN